MPLNDYLYRQYLLCFPCLFLVLNGVVVSIVNIKAWGLGFKPRQSQSNWCSSFFSYFFENAPGRPGGRFDPANTNFRCLTFSILWLKSKFCLLLPKWAQFFMETPPDTPRMGMALRKILYALTRLYHMTPEYLVRFGFNRFRGVAWHTYIHTHTYT